MKSSDLQEQKLIEQRKMQVAKDMRALLKTMSKNELIRTVFEQTNAYLEQLQINKELSARLLKYEKPENGENI